VEEEEEEEEDEEEVVVVEDHCSCRRLESSCSSKGDILIDEVF
jgi:hypothetical protein